MKAGVTKRGSTWSYVIDLPKDATGKRRQRWVGGFSTEKAAKTSRAQAIAKLEEGTDVKPTKETVGSFLERWLAGLQGRPTTVAGYTWAVTKHLKPALGDVRLRDLTPSRLNALYAAKKAAGLGERSRTYLHVTIRKALADAVKWGDIPRNVADYADRPRQTTKTEKATWTPTELREFLQVAESDRLFAAFVVAGTTGLRRGEVLGLRWRDIDLQKSWLVVCQSLVVVRYEVKVSMPKTASGERMVALDENTVNALIAHRVKMRDERKALDLPAPGPDDLVFSTPIGEPTHPESFAGTFDRYVKAVVYTCEDGTKVGLPRITLHGLRHSHATHALQAGIHPLVVSKRLGHASVKITLDTYSHAIPALQADAASKVASLVFDS